MIHRQTHANLDVPGCFGCRISTLRVAPSAMPSRHPQADQARQTSKEWEKDLPAYKRLVESGVQPPSTSGTARLEATADLAVEVNSGVVMTKPQRREYEAVSGDVGL